ncbi:MAG TPA: polyphosphate polymerase domain-containing protein [Steroidobacteraceae bacterium]|nr:polyphosphate polymerase domain-containing protein [Steroidobacteraceae bacterium]
MQCPPSFELPVAASEPRETREFVYELKFYVSEQSAAALLHWVRSRLAPDPHGTGAHGDSYRVSSIYFDTPSHDVLGRHGSFARSKYRVRRYGDGSEVYLERKTRGAYRVFKRRSAIPAAALPALLAAEPMRGWSGYWFHRRLLARRLAAVTRVDYQRIARIGQSSYGPLRLTLDEALSAAPARELAFGAGSGAVALSHPGLILELKFGHAMPAVFKSLIREFAPRLAGISKYRLAAQALGLAPGLLAARAAAGLAGPAADGAVECEPPPASLGALAPLVPAAC